MRELLYPLQQSAELCLEPFQLFPVLRLLGIGDQALKPMDLLNSIVTLWHCHRSTFYFYATLRTSNGTLTLTQTSSLPNFSSWQFT